MDSDLAEAVAALKEIFKKRGIAASFGKAEAPAVEELRKAFRVPSRFRAFLLAAGAKGKRYSLPHARILIHQPLGGFSGQATDIDIHAKEILRTRDKLNELLVKHTGQPLERIKSDTERDYFMSAIEAKEYGLVDDVLVQKLAAPTGK